MYDKVVLIPAYQRPEFLWLCLEHITKANNYNENHYIINFDYGYRRLNIEVINHWKSKFKNLEINYISKCYICQTASKQSHSVLEGYRLAKSKSSRLVYMIEEDVMVARDFFDWHSAIHEAEPNIYCSIGTRNNNTRYDPRDNYSDYYIKENDYQSLGVCFKADMLNLVLKHANHQYYTDPFSYCKKNWPNSRIGNAFVEQDGLHRRVMIQHGLYNAFSFDGFAFHAGFYGYNRKGTGRVTGPLTAKVEKARAIAFNKRALLELVKRSGYSMSYYNDSEPVPLKTSWNGKLNRIHVK